MKLKQMLKGLLFVAVLVMVLLTAACSTAATETPAQPTAVPEATQAPSDEMVELTMWDIVVSDSFDEWWRNYIDEFNASHPNIHVNYETFESEAYKAKMSSAIIAGTAPDIFYQIPGPETTVWYDEGRLLPLDDVLDADRFIPAARDGCSYDGTLVCVPMYLAPSFMYYNKAQFADAGVDPESWADPMRPTWEEFLSAVDALGNADNWPGMFFYWAIQNRFGGLDGFLAAVEGNGGSYTDASFIKAGDLIQELTNMDAFPDGFNGIGGDQKYTLFTQGNGAMIYQGPWMLGSISSDAPEDFEFGIFHFPTFADGDPDAQTDLMSGIDALWINADSPHTAEAAEFLKGFYDPENAISFMMDTENISSIAGTFEAAKAAGEDAPILTLAEASSTAAHVYPWWDWAMPPNVSEEMLNMAQALFIGEITPQEFGQNLESLR
jgi:raffinose/stachyose/melibiose transport system substrate-binding protein